MIQNDRNAQMRSNEMIESTNYANFKRNRESFPMQITNFYSTKYANIFIFILILKAALRENHIQKQALVKNFSNSTKTVKETL